ncbi:hypothetical protein HR086_46950 [Myxococcus sp. CA039A]|nr:hypothetical protein [Myxococcus sp. CA039A]
MPITEELTKEARIKKEITRLKRILKDVPKDKLTAAEGLIRRAAFMQVTLEDLEADINEKGTIESFSQTEGIVYDRERPAARLYNTTIRNYAAACKQLIDLLPDGKPKADVDELMAFVKGAPRK